MVTGELQFDDETLRSMGLDPNRHRALVRKRQIEKLEETLGVAEVRCEGFDQLLERLDGIWDDPFRGIVAERLAECDLTEGQERRLDDRLVAVDAVALDLDRNARSRLDRIVAKLIRALPASLRREYALRDLSHRRKLRRNKALQIFERGGTGKEYAPRLWECYEEHGDQEFLQAIARDGTAVRKVGAARLLGEIDEPYWRMRVFESLLESDRKRAARNQADSNPWAFTYAVGRVRATEEMDSIVELAEQNHTEPRFLGIYAWALGRLRGCEMLPKVREWAERLQ